VPFWVGVVVAVCDCGHIDIFFFFASVRICVAVWQTQGLCGLKSLRGLKWFIYLNITASALNVTGSTSCCSDGGGTVHPHTRSAVVVVAGRVRCARKEPQQQQHQPSWYYYL
jgi:hypothetical protein